MHPSGNANEPEDGGTCPGKRFLFFLKRSGPLNQVNWRQGVQLCRALLCGVRCAGDVP